MGWLDDVIQRGVKRGCERAIAEKMPDIRRHIMEAARPIIDEAINDAIRNSPLLRFIKAGQMHLLKHLVDVDHKQAWDLFRDALKDHLHDEKIKFGDLRYSWTAADARDLAQELVIDHAEAAP